MLSTLTNIPITVPVHNWTDYEYQLSEVTPGPSAAQLSGTQNYQVWNVVRPNVQKIMVEHIYSTHGQFADWELGNVTIPAYMQRGPGF